MTAERWRQVKTIFQNAIETAPEMRRAFLDANCGEDAELRSEIESMLDFEADSTKVFDSPVFDVAVRLMTADEILPPGAKVDNYRIVREIGRGGMGAVFLAERDDGLFDQKAAVKIIKRGMDTDLILKRFMMERQILAALDSPNIAHLLDGGTTDDGLPYFVMEYVEGLPIDKFCDERKLNVNERLQLFRKVCAAVSYAHQNLIVHRDLKPSNILVTKEGEPKLLDFGIAKLLNAEPTSETEATATVARLLTPEYASPEQIAGEKITTQSDVYSLGVLLSKLVNRQWSVVSGKSSDKNSTLPNGRLTTDNGRLTNSDLEAILETARRAEPERRYATVDAFSEDIRRLLAGLPVLAQKDSAFYRASKFVRRNAAVVALSLLAIFALGFTAAFALWQANRANLEKLRAERRFSDVRKLANKVLFEYHGAIEDLPNSTEVREKMLKDSLEYLDSLSAEATSDRELLRELGAAYEKVGTIQGNSWFGNLNDTPAMVRSYQKSFEIREKLVALDPANDELRRELAIALENLGDVSHQTGDLRGAIERYERARQIIAELAAKDLKHQTYLARLHSQIAHIQGFPGESNLGETAASIENYRRAVEIMQRLYEIEPNNPKYLWGLAVYRRNLGNMLLFSGDAQTALGEVNKSLELSEAWIKIEPDNVNAQQSFALSYSKLADIHARLGDLPRAIEFQQKAIAADEPRYLADPKDRRAREISIWYYKLADLYVKKRDFAAAEKWHFKALPIFAQNFEEDPTSIDNQISLADAHFSIAEMFKESGELGKAKEFYEKCQTVYETVAARDPANFRVRVNAAQAIVGLGDVFFKKGERAAALANYEKVLPVLQAAAEKDKQNPELQNHLNSLNAKIAAAQ